MTNLASDTAALWSVSSIFVKEAWASRAAFNPKSDNPNGWWNNGKGLPDKIS